MWDLRGKKTRPRVAGFCPALFNIFASIFHGRLGLEVGVGMRSLWPEEEVAPKPQTQSRVCTGSTITNIVVH